MAEHMDQHAAHQGLHHSGENGLMEEHVNQHSAHQDIHHGGATRLWVDQQAAHQSLYQSGENGLHGGGYGPTSLFRIARAGIFPRSSLLGAGQLGFWEFGKSGTVG